MHDVHVYILRYNKSYSNDFILIFIYYLCIFNGLLLLCLFSNCRELPEHWNFLLGNSVFSYLLDQVSLCLLPSTAWLWALLCVCGVSGGHSRPHGRLKNTYSNQLVKVVLHGFENPHDHILTLTAFSKPCEIF